VEYTSGSHVETRFSEHLVVYVGYP
jgi:hypothetical protein